MYALTHQELPLNKVTRYLNSEHLLPAVRPHNRFSRDLLIECIPNIVTSIHAQQQQRQQKKVHF